MLTEEWKDVHESAFHLNFSPPKVLHGFLKLPMAMYSSSRFCFYSATLSEALQGCPRFSKVRQRTHSLLKLAKVRWGSRVLQEKILQGSKMFHEVRLGFLTFWEGRWGSARFFWVLGGATRFFQGSAMFQRTEQCHQKKVQYGCVRFYRFLKVPQRFVKFCKVLEVSVRFSKVRCDSIRYCEVLRG